MHSFENENDSHICFYLPSDWLIHKCSVWEIIDTDPFIWPRLENIQGLRNNQDLCKKWERMCASVCGAHSVHCTILRNIVVYCSCHKAELQRTVLGACNQIHPFQQLPDF